MSVNYTAVLVATIVDFVIGAIWYMPVFGNVWGKIHGFDKLSKKEQDEARKGMGPLLLVQLLITAVTAWALAKLNLLLPTYSIYTLALLLWTGFVVPTQLAAIIFGGTEPKWVVTKALIMAGGSLACLEAAAYIIKTIQ